MARIDLLKNKGYLLSTLIIHYKRRKSKRVNRPDICG